MRAFSIPRLTSLLCRVSADMFWSKMERARGGIAPIFLGGRWWEPIDERRTSLYVRLGGRGTGENDLSPRREPGRDRA